MQASDVLRELENEADILAQMQRILNDQLQRLQVEELVLKKQVEEAYSMEASKVSAQFLLNLRHITKIPTQLHFPILQNSHPSLTPCFMSFMMANMTSIDLERIILKKLSTAFLAFRELQK